MAKKIYTRTGDEGETALFGGTRLPKDHIRIEAYGTLDELNAEVGLLRDLVKEPSYLSWLLDIQIILFDMGSHLASTEKMAAHLPELSQSLITQLEDQMDLMSNDLPALKHFILPGGHPTVSQAHICRTVTRRAERRVVSLQHVATVHPIIGVWLNRLSDWFFVLSRSIAAQLDITEVYWQGRI